MDTSVEFSSQSIQYGVTLEPLIIADPTPPDGYTFHGWYSDPECTTRVFFAEPTAADLAELKYDLNSAGRKTYKSDGEETDKYVVMESMPASNYVLYANWAPKRFQINIDPNGGELLRDNSQATYFNIDYGEKIGEYANITRRYVKISEGQDVSGQKRYSYHYDSRTNNDGEHRWAYYYEDPNGDYILDENAYAFVGWYKVANNGAGAVERAPFNFESLVEEDTTLRAMWRREGVFKVKYINHMGSLYSTDAAPAEDTYTYLDLAEAKVGPAIAAPSNYMFAGWRVLGTETPTYQPGDVFTIDSNFAEYDEKETMYVTLEPVFVQIETTTLDYQPNGGSGQLSDLDQTQPGNDAIHVTGNTVENILVNSAIHVSSGATFIRPGYKLIGWSDQAIDPAAYPITRNSDGSFSGSIPSGATLFQLGGTYGISGASNTLYAVWEKDALPIRVLIYEDGKWQNADPIFTGEYVHTSPPNESENGWLPYGFITGGHLAGISTQDYTDPDSKYPTKRLVTDSATYQPYQYAFGKVNGVTVQYIRYAVNADGSGYHWEYCTEAGGAYTPLGATDTLDVYYFKCPVPVPVYWFVENDDGTLTQITNPALYYEEASLVDRVHVDHTLCTVSEEGSKLYMPDAIWLKDGSGKFDLLKYGVGPKTVTTDTSQMHLNKTGWYIMDTQEGLVYSTNRATEGEGDDYRLVEYTADSNIGIYVIYGKPKMNFTLNKIVDGAMGNRSQDFTLTISVSPSGTYQYTKNGGTMENLPANGQITVKHGDTIVISGLPTNAALTITENDGMNGVYKKTWTKRSGTATGTASNNNATFAITLTDDTAYTLTNDLPAVAPTGYNVTVVPYILMLALGLALAAVAASRRKGKGGDADA